MAGLTTVESAVLATQPLLLIRQDAQQRVVVLPDGGVALARTLSHPFDVGDADTPSPAFKVALRGKCRSSRPLPISTPS